MDMHISSSASSSTTATRPDHKHVSPELEQCASRQLANAPTRLSTPEATTPVNMDEILLSPSNTDVPASAPRYKFNCSGRYLYFKPSPSSTTGLAAPFQGTIRLDDASAVRSLSTKERAELAELAPAPPVGSGFLYAVSRFPSRARSLAELREVVYSRPFPAGETYSRTRHGDACYVNDAAAMILSVMESLSTTSSWMGPQGLREGWYGVNVWGPLIDRAFHMVPSCVLARTEIKSRVDQGENHRFDGIVCGLAGHEVAEFGAIEVAKDAETVVGEKCPRDREKLVRIMESMLKALLDAVEGDMTIGRLLAVVGVQHVGYTIRVLRMHAIKEDVFVLHPGRVRVVPTQVDQFDDLLDVMRAIITAKNIVARSMQLVAEYRRPDNPNREFTL